MSTQLSFGRDINSYNAYAPIPSTTVFSATLSAGTASSVTVPLTHAVWVVAFSVQPGADAWVDFTGATAAAPVAGTFAASTSVLNPGQRMVPGGTVISIVTNSTTADVSVEMYSVSYP